MNLKSQVVLNLRSDIPKIKLAKCVFVYSQGSASKTFNSVESAGNLSLDVPHVLFKESCSIDYSKVTLL